MVQLPLMTCTHGKQYSCNEWNTGEAEEMYEEMDGCENEWNELKTIQW